MTISNVSLSLMWSNCNSPIEPSPLFPTIAYTKTFSGPQNGIDM